MFSAPRPSECQIRRSIILKAFTQNLQLTLKRTDVHLPTCDEAGQFNEIQCSSSTEACWCVDHDGNEVVGTRTESANPKCPKR